jgi:hypothetical protein
LTPTKRTAVRTPMMSPMRTYYWCLVFIRRLRSCVCISVSS